MVDWFTLEALIADFEAIVRAYPGYGHFVVKLWPHGMPSVEDIRAAIADRGWALDDARQGDWKGPDRIRA